MRVSAVMDGEKKAMHRSQSRNDRYLVTIALCLSTMAVILAVATGITVYSMKQKQMELESKLTRMENRKNIIPGHNSPKESDKGTKSKEKLLGAVKSIQAESNASQKRGKRDVDSGMLDDTDPMADAMNITATAVQEESTYFDTNVFERYQEALKLLQQIQNMTSGLWPCKHDKKVICMRGPRGFKGDVGMMGPQGPNGFDGMKGARGHPGIKGESGEPGLPGRRGVPGPTGRRGRQGPVGPGGPQGPPGFSCASKLKPTIVLSPQNESAAEESPAEFSCQASGNPSPKFTWRLNGVAVDVRDRRFHITALGVNGSALRINSVKKEDGGKLECVATNLMGEDSGHAILSVLPKKEFQYVVPKQGARTLKLSWSIARQWCKFLDGDLASIVSPSEEQRISSVLNHVRYDQAFWIGANDVAREGRFVWSDGTRFSYTNWHRREPNNKGSRGPEDCVHLMKRRGSSRKWNDLNCDFKQAFVCKMPVV